MSWYLPFALLFTILFGFLVFHSYKKQRPTLVFYGGLLMLVILRTCSAFYNGIWNTDEAEWVSIGYGLSNCDIPYQCYDAHSTGFFNIVVLQALHYLGIEYTYTSLRLFGLFLFLVPAVIVFYYTVRRTLQPREQVLATGLLIHFLLFGAYNHDMLAYNSEYIIMFFTAVLFYCNAAYKQDGKVKWLILAAVCIGIIPFAKLQGVPIAFGFGLILATNTLRKKRTVHLLLLGAVSLLPLLIIFLSFRQLGVWDDFRIMYVQSNQYLVSFSGAGFFDKLKTFIHLQRWVAPYYILAVLLLGFAVSRDKFRRESLKTIDWAPVIILGCAYFATAASGWGAEHYNTLIIIPLFLSLATFIRYTSVTSWLDKRRNTIRFAGGLSLMALVFTMLPELDRFKKRVYDDAWPYAEQLVAYIQQEIPPGQPLCVLGWFRAVEIQVDAKRPLATRTAHNFYLLAEKDEQLMNYYQQQYITDLERSKPVLIVDASYELDNALLAPIKQYIDTHYTPDTVLNNSPVYKRMKL